MAKGTEKVRGRKSCTLGGGGGMLAVATRLRKAENAAHAIVFVLGLRRRVWLVRILVWSAASRHEVSNGILRSARRCLVGLRRVPAQLCWVWSFHVDLPFVLAMTSCRVLLLHERACTDVCLLSQTTRQITVEVGLNGHWTDTITRWQDLPKKGT